MEHECTEQCVCPIHATQALYSRYWDTHACQKTDCVNSEGFEEVSEYGFNHC